MERTCISMYPFKNVRQKLSAPRLNLLVFTTRKRSFFVRLAVTIRTGICSMPSWAMSRNHSSYLGRNFEKMGLETESLGDKTETSPKVEPHRKIGSHYQNKKMHNKRMKVVVPPQHSAVIVNTTATNESYYHNHPLKDKTKTYWFQHKAILSPTKTKSPPTLSTNYGKTQFF
jgi:hypothetical protein